MTAVHFHQDVEEAMSTLQDSDQLVQVTVDNRERLMSVLNNLVSRLTLDAKSVRALMDVELDSPQKIVQCTEAARNLDTLLNAPTVEGQHFCFFCLFFISLSWIISVESTHKLPLADGNFFCVSTSEINADDDS